MLEPAPGLSCDLQGGPHAEEVSQGAGPRHTDDARAALATPRPGDPAQGQGTVGRQGLGCHHRPRERVDDPLDPTYCLKYRHLAIEPSLHTV